jgi:nicotinamidase-related amidase
MTMSPKQKSTVLPTGGGAALMDPADAVILLLDHQSGLFQTVKDIPVADLRRNVEMVARLATLLNIPVITTASEPSGSNGPLMPEIHELAPHAVHVPRKGEVNAWDNGDFVAQVEATGRKTLIMAGVWTSVCVMFPALDARAAGYEVYAVVDASGDPSEMASRTSLARFVQGGVKPISTNASGGRGTGQALRLGGAELRRGHGKLPDGPGRGQGQRLAALHGGSWRGPWSALTRDDQRAHRARPDRGARWA